jgi:hypothetical protein
MLFPEFLQIHSERMPHLAYGLTPKVIWLRSWDYPTAVAEQLLRNGAIRVSELVQDSEQRPADFDPMIFDL